MAPPEKPESPEKDPSSPDTDHLSPAARAHGHVAAEEEHEVAAEESFSQSDRRRSSCSSASDLRASVQPAMAPPKKPKSPEKDLSSPDADHLRPAARAHGHVAAEAEHEVAGEKSFSRSDRRCLVFFPSSLYLLAFLLVFFADFENQEPVLDFRVSFPFVHFPFFRNQELFVISESFASHFFLDFEQKSRTS
jgi:hypothetical protein